MAETTKGNAFSDRGPTGGNFFERRIADIRQRLDDKETRPVTIALLGAAGVMLLLFGYWMVLLLQLPTINELRQARFAQSTVAYTADGEELTRYGDKNRVWVGLDSVATPVKEALIATEDHRFYQHWGIDVKRTFGSILKTATGDVQGGSTITMQLARNTFPDIGDDFALTRKFKEWITALRIEGMYDKDTILEMYLNMVPFMYNAWGIEAAANTYYQKSALNLNLDESAMLVGMLKGTVFYNPVRNPERAHERRNTVLQQMVKHGYLEETQLAEVKDRETKLRFKRLTREEGIAPYFAEYVRRWLDEWAEGRGFNLYTDGLRVYTTIDAGLQKAAQTALRDVGEGLENVAAVEWSRSSSPYFSSNAGAYASYRQQVPGFAYLWESKPELLNTFIRQSDDYRRLTKNGLSEEAALDTLRANAAFVDSVKTSKQRLQAAFVAMDPHTGHVKAWVGGRDFGTDQYDHVAQAKRQPGSTFKPFVYATAIDAGFSPNDVMRDEVREYVDPDTKRRWRPTNVSSASGELVTLKDALAYSKNTITAQLVVDLGPSRVAQTARRMGIQSELDEVPSIGLGTSEVTLLEMVAAYGTLADGGTYHEPIFVTRIETADGRVVATFDTEAKAALSERTAYTVLDMMRGVVEYGTGVRIRSYGAQGDLAGKTGTTQGGADGWFMLVHPNLVTGAWVGFSSPSIRFRSNYWGQGAHTALPIVGSFYRSARGNPLLDPSATFGAPAGYAPPTRSDSSYYAFDDDDFTLERASYTDSLTRETDRLLARSDSLLEARRNGRVAERDWDNEDDQDLERALREQVYEVIDEGEEPEDRTSRADERRAEEAEEDMSAADSLNRAQRKNSDVLRQGQRGNARDNRGQQKKEEKPKKKNNGNGNNGNGNGNNRNGNR